MRANRREPQGVSPCSRSLHVQTFHPVILSAGIREEPSVQAGFCKATGQSSTPTVEASQVFPKATGNVAPPIVRRNNLMQLPEFTRSTTLRWSFLVAGLFAAFIVTLLGFIYLKTHGDLTMRSDRMITSQMDVFAALPSERRLDAIGERLKQDPRRVLLAGLFGPGGRRIAGNLERLPPDLEIDNAVQSAVVDRVDESGREKQAVRLIARSLPGGDVLVIGRNVDEMEEIASVVGSALALGLIAAVLICLAVGVTLSARTRKRIVEVNERVPRIVAGNLSERLPYRKANDPLSTLTMIVNGMLDEMETLIHSLAVVGNDIAHDLRTPLTRARLTLERGRTGAQTLERLPMVADKTIEGIDQSLSIVTAILRLAEIENSQRSAGFGTVALSGLGSEGGEMCAAQPG